MSISKGKNHNHRSSIKNSKLGIVWFRRDLRLYDNTAFNLSIKECDEILPIFIFTPQQLEKTKNKYFSANSVQFMCESLEDLKKDISLSTFYGTNKEIFEKLFRFLKPKYDSISVYVNKDYTPFSKKRDDEIHNICSKNGIHWNSCEDLCMFPPKTIRTTTNKIYEKFTPYYDKCIYNISKVRKVEMINDNVWQKKIMKQEIIDGIHKNISDKNQTTILNIFLKFTNGNMNQNVNGGRRNGLQILENMKRWNMYAKKRNDLTYDTTMLSAYIKYGCVSIREVFWRIYKLFGKNSSLLRQLLWRDFYIQIVNENPQVISINKKNESFKKQYDNIVWQGSNKHFELWKEGKTGFPIVDACMRQLNETGYMHNRGRLIVSSFLIKILLIDWRKGEEYFANQLIDYDPIMNNMNWQGQAGSGADSQPYFRIYNPWLQAEKHDLQGEFIKKWVPELSSISSKDIHKWNEVCDKYLNEGIEYYKPIVDYKTQREKAIQMYKKSL